MNETGVFQILVINPGSTSTRVALYDDEDERIYEEIRHKADDLAGFRHIADQYEFRVSHVRGVLESRRIQTAALHAVVGRGGLLKPVQGGTYRVGPAMIADLKEARHGQHASNLGALIAFEMARPLTIPAFVVDPVVVDEMDPVARPSGMPDIERRSIFHALNQKAAAREAAGEMGKPYNAVRLIVAHLGGGISVGAHVNGRVIDVNNALNGDGPFAPERAGGLPAGQLADLCFSGQYTRDGIHRRLAGKAGLVAYLGTNDVREVKDRISKGDSLAENLYEAMAYQVAKEIGSMAAVLQGRVDGIVITGGLAHDDDFVKRIRSRTGWIAPCIMKAGEMEMAALARGALRVLRKEETAREYE